MLFNYQVVVRENIGDLIDCVSKNRKKGWSCVGGIAFDGANYLQAIEYPLTEVTGLHDTEKKFIP